MEFRLAAEGNVDELRQWLRGHPERVNVPAPGSNLTLLYTAISNANRTDLASLQAGNSRYLNTVRMLCEEYKADPLVPNGGSYNNALHIAASNGATDILQYLVDTLRTPVDRANVFGERALQMAERGGHVDCVAILQRPVAANRGSVTLATTATTSGGSMNLGALGSGNPSRFHSVTVSDSDQEDDGDETSSTAIGPQRQSSNTTNNGTVAPQSGGPLGNVPRPLYANPQAAAQPEHLPATQLTSQRGSFLSSGGATTTGGDHVPSPPSQYTPVGGQYAALRGDSNYSIGAGELPRSASTAGAAAGSRPPRPLLPQREYDITKSRVLANPDLQGFRSAYGDGFKYLQCSDHYEIRGILPYTYRGAVYYTPVIISVHAPPSSSSAAELSGAFIDGREGLGGSASDPSSPMGGTGSQRSGLGPETGLGPCEVYCRFRVCLNMQQLNDFAVSRKAEYLDPVSGAIIPSPGDDKYQTLTAYIRNVVVHNFQAVPPLIVPTSSYAFPLQPNVSQLGAADNADPYRHHHSHNAPAFMKNALPARTASHIRCSAILRELSRFGDGLGRYFPQTHRIVVYVPIFSERKASLLAMPQERPSAPASPIEVRSPTTAAAAAGGKKGVAQQVATEAVAELQVRVWMQFSPIGGADDGGVYAYPPRVYLIDAAACPPAFLTGSSLPAASSLTGACFAAVLRDGDTGEVNPERIAVSQESWSAKGSVYEVLVELQRVLRAALEAFAMSYTGRRLDSCSAPPANAAAANVFGRGGFASGAPNSLAHSPAAASLDTFFASPTTASQAALSGLGGDAERGAAGPSGNGSGRCLYCFQPLQTRTLLQPCGHDGMCGHCVKRLQSHCREEVFACPVCRSKMRTVMDVFL